MSDYPISHDPVRFLECREGKGISGFFKRLAEKHSLNQCFALTDSLETAIDVPCGAGRLFPYWRTKFRSVTGIDLSTEMLGAAQTAHQKHNLHGRVMAGNAFELSGLGLEPADMVICVRFCYYFDESTRLELLASLASVSKRYLLIQYKTSETLKGKRNRKRQRGAGSFKKFFNTQSEIEREIATAGFRCLKIAPIGMFSDRVYVLAEKQN